MSDTKPSILIKAAAPAGPEAPISIRTNITERFQISRDTDRANYLEKEVDKIGNLRAGSTGIMSENGDIAGACHRKSHLRSLGIELDPPDVPTLIMFELGYANEDRVMEILRNTLAPDEVILQEEEIPIAWTTSNDTKVTGRPDIVICKEEQVDLSSLLGEAKNAFERETLIAASKLKKITPVLGLELKSVHSVWVAREVFFNESPKLPNLVQAAHYMWKLDIPYKIIYRGYSQLGQGMGGNKWMSKMFPKPGEKYSEWMAYNDKTGEPKHIRPFECVYDLEFDKHGRLRYRIESVGKWVPTIITKQDIERYFEFTSKIASSGNLGPRPMAVDATGGKAGYKDCDYCPLKSTCDAFEDKGYETWLREVRKKEAEGKIKLLK